MFAYLPRILPRFSMSNKLPLDRFHNKVFRTANTNNITFWKYCSNKENTKLSKIVLCWFLNDDAWLRLWNYRIAITFLFHLPKKATEITLRLKKNYQSSKHQYIRSWGVADKDFQMGMPIWKGLFFLFCKKIMIYLW